MWLMGVTAQLVKRRTASTEVGRSNPGGGMTKKNRSFHDLVQLGLKYSKM